jgi:hypothetical protein
MTGPMREAQDGVAIIHDVEVDSFIRFAEYIYGGDYNVVQHTIKSEQREYPEDDCPISEPSVEHDDWDFPTKGSKKSIKKSRKAIVNFPELETLLSLVEYPVVSPVREAFPVITTDTFPGAGPAKDCDKKCDFTEVLLCHARVYCMADRFQVPRLKELAIYKLYMLLRQIIDSSDCYVSNIVSLLGYVYGHTAELESTSEPLRDLLAHYVAWDFRSRMGEEDFRVYLAENGAFARDVCEKVSMRL